MTLGLALTLLAILALVVLSAFFSGSETALTAASRAKMHAMEQDGSSRAGLVNRLINARERLIGAILLGNNLVNILASVLATSLFLSLFGDAGVAYATLVMTALVLVFGEVMPKTYAISKPERVALAVAPVIRLCVALFAPVTAAVQIVVRALFRLIGSTIDKDTAVLSAHDELRGAIELHHQEGGVVKHDRDMLGGVLDLADLEIADVMVHRTTMHTLNADDPQDKIVDEALKSPYTRLPLWQGEPENIVGILHAKTLLVALREVNGDLSKLDILSLCAPPWFVPETTMVKDQLNAFLRRKAHFALVVDEFGEVMGLVTLEDILEEIVGEITDEHDVTATGVRPQPDGTVNVDGSVPIRDLNRLLDWDLPDEEATTIAGLVIHEAQTIPEPGQAFTFHGFRFEVLRRQRNKISALKIKPPVPREAEPAAG
ncbi:MAG: HlyC/CorC family transporter [Hyphomicrobiales bacterium]|nr:HlyC/CorC family transporter [Hyphomicrobiales bacterium]